jgi:hypothetical protein
MLAPAGPPPPNQEPIVTRLVSKLACTVVAAAAAAFAPAAQAVPIELALVLDASGSINSSEWTLQRSAYANAIAAAVPIDGSVAISVVRFAQTASVVRPLTVISSAADRSALASFFDALSQSGNGGNTCISCGIRVAEGTLTGTADRSLIDVSTDGVWNVGVNPAGPATTVGTAAWAVANEADAVNALGIGVVPDFNAGDGSFSVTAPDFTAFQSALVEKLRRETNFVSEPASAALLLIALGLGAFARRRMG